MYRRMSDTNIGNAEIKSEITLSISGSGDFKIRMGSGQITGMIVELQ